MSVRHRGGNKYYIILSQGRNAPALYIPFEGSEAEAHAHDRELKGAKAAAGVKVSELAIQYCDWYQRNRMPRSFGELKDSLKRLLPHFGHLPAAFILSSHLEGYKAKRAADTWQDRPTSKITINRELKHLMAMLRWSAARGLIPAPQVKPEYHSKRHCEAEERPISALSAGEIREFLTVLKGPVWLIFVIMFWTGIRKLEACSLRVQDIDLKRGVFRLKGKGGKVSNEPIPASLISKLEIAMKGKRPADWLCPNPRTGEPYTDLRKRMMTACKRAGITKRFHPHACRHTFATVMDTSGASIVEIQSRLRHADVATTRKYIQRIGSGGGVDYMGEWMSGQGK